MCKKEIGLFSLLRNDLSAIAKAAEYLCSRRGQLENVPMHIFSDKASSNFYWDTEALRQL